LPFVSGRRSERMLSTLMNLCAGMAIMAPIAPGAPEETKMPPAAQQQAAETKPEDITEDDLLPVENLVIERTNKERVRHGLRPLRFDSRLERTARRHTAWMT